MALSWTKAEGLALLYQFFLIGMSACLSEFHEHADLLHISLPLFNFVPMGAFIKNGKHPACPLGEISAWISLQVLGGRGAAAASTLANIVAQDSRLSNADSLYRGVKFTLLFIVGSDNLCSELRTFCYILADLFGYACLYVRDLKRVVELAASNIDAFKQTVSKSHQVTDLLDDVSRKKQISQ